MVTATESQKKWSYSPHRSLVVFFIPSLTYESAWWVKFWFSALSLVISLPVFSP